jgi:phosphoribosylformylglycinamidine cyclo-ligase
VPPIFKWLQAEGDVPDEDMYRALNMGVGLIVVCAAEHAELLLGTLAEGGEEGAVRIGEVREGGDGVRYVAG